MPTLRETILAALHALVLTHTVGRGRGSGLFPGHQRRRTPGLLPPPPLAAPGLAAGPRSSGRTRPQLRV